MPSSTHYIASPTSEASFTYTVTSESSISESFTLDIQNQSPPTLSSTETMGLASHQPHQKLFLPDRMLVIQVRSDFVSENSSLTQCIQLGEFIYRVPEFYFARYSPWFKEHLENSETGVLTINDADVTNAELECLLSVMFPK